MPTPTIQLADKAYVDAQVATQVGTPGTPGASSFTSVAYAAGNQSSTITTADATALGAGLAAGDHAISTNLTLTKPLTLLPGATISPTAGVTLTLAGLKIAAGQRAFGDFGGLLRLGRLGYIDLDWFIPSTATDEGSTYDITTALQRAIDAAAEITIPPAYPPPSPAYAANQLGGLVRFPRGVLRQDGQVTWWYGVTASGTGRHSSIVRALSASMNWRIYDPRGNPRRDPFSMLQIDGNGVATVGVTMERGTGAALHDMSVNNCILCIWMNGCQQAELRNVDVLNSLGPGQIGVQIDRSARNIKISKGTFKLFKKYGLYITQSDFGATDGGSADTIITPQGIEVDGTIIESNMLHNIAINAGAEIIFQNGQSSGAGTQNYPGGPAGTGIAGDPNRYREPIRIAAQNTPGGTPLSRIDVSFRNWGINGAQASYGIDARTLDRVDTLAGDGTITAGSAVSNTSAPTVKITLDGDRGYSGVVAGVLLDDRSKLYPNRLQGVTPVAAKTVGATKPLADLVSYRAGVVWVTYQGVVGTELGDALPIPPGTYEVLSHTVRTPANVATTALTISMKRKSADGATNALMWLITGSPPPAPIVAVGSSLATAGTIVTAQAVINNGDSITKTATGDAGQRYTGVLVLRQVQ